MVRFKTHLNAPLLLKYKRMSKISDDDIESSEDESESTYSENDISDDDPADINPKDFFTVKELCYYKKIDKFFTGCTKENIIKMIDIINGKSSISLRVLDWFVTKYSKKRIDCGVSKDTEVFDVRISYKSQLKSYKKRYFDPFRRKKDTRFRYYFNGGQTIITTLGQLNFFKWAFTNNIVVYVEKNLKQISKEMNLANKEDKKKKTKKSKSSKKDKEKELKKTKTKKKTLSEDSTGNIRINATKIVDDDEVQIVLKFD